MNGETTIARVLESCVYATDLRAAHDFYADVLGLEVHSMVPDRHVFFRCGESMFLVFDPDRTAAGGDVPPHGTRGAGHVAFAVAARSLAGWRARLEAAGVEIEREVEWPGGGRSLYVRDPAGTSVELTTPSIWGLAGGPGGAGSTGTPSIAASAPRQAFTRHEGATETMPTRKASATWEGGLKSGTGRFESQSGAISAAYSVGTRFAEEPGTNPEELLAAADAACFSMALAGELERAGMTPERIVTDAACTVEKQGDGYTITTMRLRTRARVQNADEQRFQEIAQKTKSVCPVSRALAGVDISLEATLE